MKDQKLSNPLMSFMRHPKIYIKLPSNGEYWPEGSLDMPENFEIPIYSMTAKDEIMLKVPDALMSGQAIVNVIENCVPNIKNAWHMPSIDLDVILIAIRLATYGEFMKLPLNLNSDLNFEYQVDLRQVLDKLILDINWNPIIALDENITIYVQPLNYKHISDGAIKTFETQKIIDAVNNQSLSDEEKLKIYNENFKKLTDIRIGIVQNSIFKIDSSNGSTENREHIEEFINNIDKNMFDVIQNHLEKLKEINSIKPLKIEVTEDMKSTGITEDFIEVPLIFDPSTFFA